MTIRRIIVGLFSRMFQWLPDKPYLKIRYRLEMGVKLNLEAPSTFNEKLNWLKLNARNVDYSNLVDKAEVKKYVEKIIGTEYIIPTYGVWDNFDCIDFETLPDQFVLKSTNGGGGTGVAICKNKDGFNKKQAKILLEKSMRTNWSYQREWVYKYVKPRIIAEKLIVDDVDGDLKDYKIFCFNGKALFCKVDFNRFVEHHANYYDINWNLQQWGEKLCPPQLDVHHPRPVNFSKMILIAEQISKKFPFARIDLYNTNGQIYFGEFTFYPSAGLGKFVPSETDYMLGNLLSLSKINK